MTAIQATCASDALSAPQASPAANLDALIGLVAGRDAPVFISDGETIVGTVTKDWLLLTIREGR